MPVASGVSFSCPVSIKECVIPEGGCCCGGSKRKKADDAAPGPPPQHVYTDSTVDITLVNSPHIHLDSLGDALSDNDNWDHMMVDKDLMMVMFTGSRFTSFARNTMGPGADLGPDACRGKTIAAVFGIGVANIMTPLLTVAMQQGAQAQLHTTFQQTVPLTMFAFPVIDTQPADDDSDGGGDGKRKKPREPKVLGAHIIYRPSRPNVVDIAALITTRDASP